MRVKDRPCAQCVGRCLRVRSSLCLAVRASLVAVTWSPASASVIASTSSPSAGGPPLPRPLRPRLPLPPRPRPRPRRPPRPFSCSSNSSGLPSASTSSTRATATSSVGATSSESTISSILAVDSYSMYCGTSSPLRTVAPRPRPRARRPRPLLLNARPRPPLSRGAAKSAAVSMGFDKWDVRELSGGRGRGCTWLEGAAASANLELGMLVVALRVNPFCPPF